jgi:uncharacterized protein YPO0396
MLLFSLLSFTFGQALLTRVFHKVVLDVWNQKQADAVALVHKLEKQVEELKERKRKLNEAFIYQQVVSREDYEQMRTALNDELEVAELNVNQARVGQVEIEKVLDFAENLLLNAAEVWRQCSLEQKQRLQQALFPKGVEYIDGDYRTQETSFLFRGLAGIQEMEHGCGSATGNRTRV